MKNSLNCFNAYYNYFERRGGMVDFRIFMGLNVRLGIYTTYNQLKPSFGKTKINNFYFHNIFQILNFSFVTLPEIVNSSINIKALRMVRVLRPLKLISGIPSKKK